MTEMISVSPSPFQWAPCHLIVAMYRSCQKMESLKWSRLCYAKRNLTVRGARNVRRLTRVASHVSEACWANSPSKVGLGAVHRRRLVINIGGGKNLGHKYWGAKIWGEFIFRQKILEKFPSILSKIPDDLFFQSSTTFLQN